MTDGADYTAFCPVWPCGPECLTRSQPDPLTPVPW